VIFLFVLYNWVVIRNIAYYNPIMILSISHKGLRLYYEDDNDSKLPSEYLRKIARILTSLDAVTSEDDRYCGVGFWNS
jgi:flagellar biosynthesis protein FlhB